MSPALLGHLALACQVKHEDTIIVCMVVVLYCFIARMNKTGCMYMHDTRAAKIYLRNAYNFYVSTKAVVLFL